MMINSEDLFSRICRICLSVNNTRTVPLFENNNDLTCYGQAVISCTNVELPHLEYAPNNMCYSCLHQLRQCILFQKQCKHSRSYFERKKVNNTHLNVKENIIKQLYSNGVTVIDDKVIIKDINNDNFFKEKELNKKKLFDSNELTNKICLNIIVEPLSSLNTNDGLREDNNPKTSNDNINKWTDSDTDDDTQANDTLIRNNNSEDSECELLNVMENCLQEKKSETEKDKMKSKQDRNLKNYELLNEIEEICNSIVLDDKHKIDDSNKLNKNITEIEIDDKSIQKKTTNSDLLFQSIEEALDSEFAKQKDRFKIQNKKTIEKSIENCKKTIKILNNSQIDTEFNINLSSIKTDSELSKNVQRKEEKLAMRYLKLSKDAKVKFRNKNKKGVLKKRKLKKKNDFTCNTCDKTFKSKNTLLRHSERHAGITAFICELCGKGFVTKNELGVHLVLTHGTGRHYPCEECGYKAPKPYDLREHMRIHTGERPYACDQCGLTFRRLYIMRQHQICHTEKKFQCPKCPLRFYKLTNLRAHDNNAHARRYMYACELCGRQYARNKTVRQHLTKIHGVPREKQGKISRVFISETPLSQPAIGATTNNDNNAEAVSSC